MVTACAACASSTTTQSVGHISALVTVRSLGPVVVREDRQAVEKKVGNGKLLSTTPAGDPQHRWQIETVAYPAVQITVRYVTPVTGGVQSVEEVETESSRFKTSQGVGVGSPLSTVMTLPGVLCSGGTCQVGFASNKLPGISFFVSTGRVTRVAVQASGH